MTRVSVLSTIRAPARDVWQLVGDFGALAKWHPAFAASVAEKRGDDTVRRLTLVNGGAILERLEERDDAARRCVYTIIEGPLPVTDYLACMQVRAAEDASSCTVEWKAEFLADGVPETDAEQLISGVFQAGLNNLRRRFGD